MAMVTTSFLEINSVLSNGPRANTAMENEWIAKAPPEMQAAMISQIQMQKEQDLMDICTRMMKQVDEIGKAVTRNIGG
jgi:hypothetical protein